MISPRQFPLPDPAPRRRPTLARRFLLLLMGFIALQLLQLAIGIYNASSVARQGQIVEIVAEQRFQTWTLIEKARAILTDGNSVPARRVLAEAMTAYGQRLEQIDGVLQHSEFDFFPLVRDLRVAWGSDLAPALRRALSAPPMEASAALARYTALAPAQVERLSNIIRIVETHGAQHADSLSTAQKFIVGLTFLLMLIGMAMVRYVVVRPLRNFIKVTRAIADGAYDRQIAIYSDDELGELARNYNRMALAISNKTERLHALNEVALAVTSSLSLDRILDRIMMYGMPLCGAHGVCIAFYDLAAQRFHNRVARGLSEAYLAQQTFPTGGMADAVMHGEEYVISNSLYGNPYPLPEHAREEGVRSIICLPLESEEQRLGVIFFYRSNSERFDVEEIELIRTFSRLAAHAIRNASVHARTVDMAQTDGLTGLYNRRKFDQRLHDEIVRAQRTQKNVAVLLFDLDHFKRINDVHGHAAGDIVLKTTATVLRREIRDIDLAARIGGEEFMVLLPETDTERAKLVAERIREAIAAEEAPLKNGTVMKVTASVGIAVYPKDAASESQLVEKADHALYMAKRDGRNRTVAHPG